jgi:hypothetical protein
MEIVETSRTYTVTLTTHEVRLIMCALGGYNRHEWDERACEYNPDLATSKGFEEEGDLYTHFNSLDLG